MMPLLLRAALAAAVYAAPQAAAFNHVPHVFWYLRDAMRLLPYVDPAAGTAGITLGVLAGDLASATELTRVLNAVAPGSADRSAYYEDAAIRALFVLVAAALTARMPRAWLAPAPVIVLDGLLWFVPRASGTPPHLLRTFALSTIWSAAALYLVGYPLLVLYLGWRQFMTGAAAEVNAAPIKSAPRTLHWLALGLIAVGASGVIFPMEQCVLATTLLVLRYVPWREAWSLCASSGGQLSPPAGLSAAQGLVLMGVGVGWFVWLRWR